MLQKGQLCFMRNHGTIHPEFLDIKQKRFLFGSSEYCTIRMYIDGIFPKHCVITIEDQGKAYLEGLHPSALTSLNGIKMKRKTLLKDYDVITICGKEFQFTYPPKCLSSNLSIEKLLIIPHSNQIESAQMFKVFSLERNLETSHPFRECNALNTNYILSKLTYFKNDIFNNVLKCLLKLPLQEAVNISYMHISAQEADFSCSDKHLIKYMNHYSEKSFELRKKKSLKLYEFLCFIKGLLNNTNEEIFHLLPILKCVGRYSIVRASEDVLFLPLKYYYLEYLNLGLTTTHKNSQQSRIFPESRKNLISSPEMLSEKKNLNEQKQDQNIYTSRKNSISYKKRVSLAVKRYHLRKRKSIMITKYAETGNGGNLITPVSYMHEDQEVSRRAVVDTFEKENITSEKTKEKQKNNTMAAKRIDDSILLVDKEQEINVKDAEDIFRKKNIASKASKGKWKNKNVETNKTESLGKENVENLPDNFIKNEVDVKSKEKNTKKKKRSKSKVSYIHEKQEISRGAVIGTFEKENITSNKTKEKRKNNTIAAKRIDDSSLEKENIEKLPDNSFKNYVVKSKEKNTKGKKSSKSKDVKQESIEYLAGELSTNKKLAETKQSYKQKKKVDSTYGKGKSDQECNILKLSQCQRITRSMAKKGT